ncbi:MAG: hypothetical protein WAV95_02865 [Azonexus sp.]
MTDRGPSGVGWRVAFVACNKNPARFGEDPSFIYRCENLAAGLRAQGAEVWLGHLSSFPWQRRFDWVVFHRPKASWRFRLVCAWLRSRNTGMSADFDDLVFDPAFAPSSPGVLNGLVELAETVHNFAQHDAALACFSTVTVSTQPLADAIARRYQQTEVLVLPNAVHWSWHSMPVTNMPGLPERPVIGYLPGTRSHDRDFSLVSKAVSRVLANHPEVVLSVTGPLSFSVPARPGQIEHHEKMPFSRFHQRFSGVTINLAPLEATPFTCCKSALKVIEGAFWNVPTICSPLPDAERLADAGALMASGEREFEVLLERLLGEPGFYAQVSSGLRQRVLPKADVYVLAKEWLGWVRGGHVA